MEQLENRGALSLAVTRVLAEKADFVARHRRCLARDTAKATRRAVERYSRRIPDLEQARDEALEARRAELWAMLFPAPWPQRSPALSGALLFGGRAEIPESHTQISSHSVLAMFRADAEWLESAASHEQRAALEGRDPHHHPDTGWLSDPEFMVRQQKRNEKILARKRDTRTRYSD